MIIVCSYLLIPAEKTCFWSSVCCLSSVVHEFSGVNVLMNILSNLKPGNSFQGELESM